MFWSTQIELLFAQHWSRQCGGCRECNKHSALKNIPRKEIKLIKESTGEKYNQE